MSVLPETLRIEVTADDIAKGVAEDGDTPVRPSTFTFERHYYDYEEEGE